MDWLGALVKLDLPVGRVLRRAGRSDRLRRPGHGAVLEEECLVANGCTVLDGARVGARSLVAAHSLVAANAVIPPGVLAAGSPAQVKRPIDGTAAEIWVTTNPGAYAELAQRHKGGVEPVELA